MQPPPFVSEVYPSPRSFGVSETTEIWARFMEPLDPATVHARNVFLKVDDARIPVEVGLDQSRQTVLIRPLTPLALNRTHSVRLTTGICDAAGVSLGQEVTWQFVTISVAFPDPSVPAAGSTNKGPWTALIWQATEHAAGPVSYAVYVGPDSAAIAERRLSPFRVLSRAACTNPAGWPLGETFFWAVTATNQATHESRYGATARFETIPKGTPVDSLEVPPFEWGYFSSIEPSLHSCFADLVTSDNAYAAIRYQLSGVPDDLEIADVRIDISLTDSSWPRNPGGSSILAAVGEWLPCRLDHQNPTADLELGDLALGARVRIEQIRFTGPALSGYLQEVLAQRDSAEFILRSLQLLTYNHILNPDRTDLAARLRVSYYRTVSTR